jgi:putative salt-induced outer membrane protein
MGYKNTLFQDWAFKVGFYVKYTEIVPEGSQQTDTITTFNLLYTFQ